MFENYNELMSSIAEALYESVNEDWHSITISVERGIESIQIDGYFLDINNEEKEPDLMSIFMKTRNLFRELYQTMTVETDKHKWNRAKATLTDEMKLNMEFEWDQELADELERLSKKV